jgi:hypothetical protein
VVALPFVVSIAFQGRRLSPINAMWMVPTLYILNILIFPIFFLCCIFAAKQRLAREAEPREQFERLDDREKGQFIGKSVF